MAPVNGTVSATVIQSMPSMKLTRLTNHTPPTNRHQAFEPPRNERQDLPFRRQRGDQRADRDALQNEPRRRRQRADVIDRADQSEQNRCRAHREEWASLDLQPGWIKHGGTPRDRERRGDYRNAAALGRRLMVRRSARWAERARDARAMAATARSVPG